MSLLDTIGSAEGSPARNYLRGGRTVGRIRAVSFRDSTPKFPKAAFRVDIEILGSTNPKHAGEKGQTACMNLSFRYPEQDLAIMRRALAAAASSKEGKVVTEPEAAARAKEFVGETQPLVGALVAIEALEKPKKKNPNETFTQYELQKPTENDLVLAGLV